MNIIKIFFSCFFSIVLFTSLQAQEDSVRYTKDSAIVTETDPTTDFFQHGERITFSTKTLLITKTGKIIRLQAWLKDQDMRYSDHTLADLDNDGKKELLVSNFTGGAHCCDEIYIFKNTGVNKFQYIVKLFAGNTEITKEKKFIYNFHEQLGYFFTCFACSYDDTSKTAPVPVHSITLKYTKGKLAILPGDKQLRNTINDNLAKLGAQPYEKPDDYIGQDNGLRKEIAMNLAVFYYSFGRSLPETQKLFYNYYKHSDAKKIWIAFVKNLNYIKSDNDF